MDVCVREERKRDKISLTSLAPSRNSSRLGRSSCVAACRSSTSQAGRPICAAMESMERAYVPDWRGSTRPLTRRMSAVA